jgi:hypothetical protein
MHFLRQRPIGSGRSDLCRDCWLPHDLAVARSPEQRPKWGNFSRSPAVPSLPPRPASGAHAFASEWDFSCALIWLLLPKLLRLAPFSKFFRARVRSPRDSPGGCLRAFRFFGKPPFPSAPPAALSRGPYPIPKCFGNTADLLCHWIATLSSAMGALGTMRLCEAHRARRTSYGCGILRCTASNRAGTIPVQHPKREAVLWPHGDPGSPM